MITTRYQLTPVPFSAVQFSDPFWAPRIETNRAATIPHVYNKLEETGRISAFDLNFERPVPSPIVLIFGDSDTAKWIEAASYSLATHPDSELAGMLDRVVDKVIAAQQPDGYLNTHFTRAQPEMRWKNLRDWHELYCAGHLIEGAVATSKPPVSTGCWMPCPAMRTISTRPLDSSLTRSRVTAVTPRSSWHWCDSTMRPGTAATWNFPGISLRSAANRDRAKRTTLTSKRTSAAMIQPNSGPKPMSIARHRCPFGSRKRWSVTLCGPCIF